MASIATTERRGFGQWLALAGFIGVCLIAGWLGTFATTPNIPTWYAALEKPWFTPPDSVFPIVWTALYILMGVAAWLVWRDGSPGRYPALVAFFVQLALNVAWSFAFFGAQNPLLGLIVIILLLAAIAWTIRMFLRISRIGGLLMAPYLAWVAFATALNGAILALN